MTVSDISGVIQVSVKTIRNELIVIQEEMCIRDSCYTVTAVHPAIRLVPRDLVWDLPLHLSLL